MLSKTLFILKVGDALIALFVNCVGLLLWFGNILPRQKNLYTMAIDIFVFVVIVLSTTYFSELYNQEKKFSFREITIRILGSLTLAFLLLSAYSIYGPATLLDRGILFLLLCAFGFLQLVWHNKYTLISKVPWMAQKVLIVGVGPLANQIEKVLNNHNHNCVLAGFIQPAGEAAVISSAPVLGSVDQILETAIKEKVHKIIISMNERRGIMPVRDILKCKFNGIAVVDGISFYEQITGKLMIENTKPSWFIFSDGFRVTAFMRWNKRLFDLVLAVIGILIIMPGLPLLALLIRLDSSGPVLFRQRRVGERDKEFVLFKFRTMHQDAEKNGAVWAQKNDPRVTRIGGFLRKSRLDEIPQLFNVLKGEMSFVGPRPERPEFVQDLQEKIPYYSNRHCIKPGITGWAQVRYPYGASEEDALEKLRYDLYYIKNLSLSLDMMIILETVKVVLLGRGGR
jgi:sugar transferase (PEP-CTERM system associated)